MTETGSSPETSPPASATGGKGEGERIEFSRSRLATTRRIAESKATIPHIYLQLTVDAGPAERFRSETELPGGNRPTVTDLVLKATGLALAEHPRVNSTYRDGGITLHQRVNLGFAVDTEDGSVTPVIRDTDSLPLAEIAVASRSLAERARSGELTPPERSGATFAVSSLGMLGITASLPVVNHGQAAKLAVGKVTETAVVRDGQVVPGLTMELTLSCDHRILHGGEAARFLAAVAEHLEHPGSLIE